MAVDRFVAIDGPGLGVTNVGVGSHRYRVTFNGPGGHSFAAFGLANPIDAMGRAIAKVAEFQVARDPKTTFNVGRVGGGTSVNAIPADAWMEVDLRSVDAASLAALDAGFREPSIRRSPRKTTAGVRRARLPRSGSASVIVPPVPPRPAHPSSEPPKRCIERWDCSSS